MSKDQTTKQTSSQEDSLANPSVLQEKEKEQMMIATSGMKLLESLEKQNQGGLLEKMLKALLTSKKAWYSDRCKMIWKQRVSKSGVLLFQLQASVRGIKGKESGLLPTPTQDSASERTKKYKQGGTPLTVAVKMFPTPNTMDHIDRKGMRPSRAATNRKSGYLSEMIKMYPTPTASDMEGGEAKDVQMKNGYFFRENKKGERWGVKLRDAMTLYPTPTARDYKDIGYQPTWKPSRDKTLPREVLKNNKPGGKLNPEFVEFLMGYPLNWTKVERTE